MKNISNCHKIDFFRLLLQYLTQFITQKYPYKHLIIIFGEAIHNNT